MFIPRTLVEVLLALGNYLDQTLINREMRDAPSREAMALPVQGEEDAHLLTPGAQSSAERGYVDASQ
jgi:hypothetical protein